MELTGTVRDQDGALRRTAVSGATYEQALSALQESVPEGSSLIVIRTDRDD